MLHLELAYRVAWILYCTFSIISITDQLTSWKCCVALYIIHVQSFQLEDIILVYWVTWELHSATAVAVWHRYFHPYQGTWFFLYQVKVAVLGYRNKFLYQVTVLGYKSEWAAEPPGEREQLHLGPLPTAPLLGCPFTFLS